MWFDQARSAGHVTCPEPRDISIQNTVPATLPLFPQASASAKAVAVSKADATATAAASATAAVQAGDTGKAKAEAATASADADKAAASAEASVKPQQRQSARVERWGLANTEAGLMTVCTFGMHAMHLMTC